MGGGDEYVEKRRLGCGEECCGRSEEIDMIMWKKVSFVGVGWGWERGRDVVLGGMVMESGRY